MADAVIRLTGVEVRRFCNGMFTNNARDLVPGSGQRTAMLDDRGRLHGLMDLHCISDTEFVGVLEGKSGDEFRARYAMYTMLDEVEVDDLDWQIITVQGAPVPPTTACVVARDRSGLGGFDVAGPADVIAELLAAMGLPELGAADMEALRIRAGLPRWPVDMGPKRLAHEMGMREDFLHFEKGCYLGQETVNRVDVMGQVRRALTGIRIAGDELPRAGAAVLDLAGKTMGTLTSPLSTSDLGNIALSVLKKPADEAGTRLMIADGDRRWEAFASALPFR